MDNNESSETKPYYGFILVKKSNGTVCGSFPVTKKEITFGRDKSCDIRIYLPNVSAQHCSIFYINNKAYIRDTSTCASTTVNGKKIGKSNFFLHQSDEIEICNRKFLWEYFKSQSEILTENKHGLKNDHTSPRISRRVSNLCNLKGSVTPSKNIKKTPSKIFISLNKTPIVEADAHMPISFYDKLKIRLNTSKSTANPQSDNVLIQSNSLVPGVNIPLPLVGKSNFTPRKSWNAFDNISTNSTHIMNELSNKRLNMESTPEYNCSYHYEDENVEFDSPANSIMLNDEHLVDTNTTVVETNNLSNPSEFVNNQVDDNLQSSSVQFNNVLPVSVPEPSSSRRDTYSIDNQSNVAETNTTPVPRRSILKCSTTAKRIKSNSRMVQFARLPNTDSRIKCSKNRFQSGSSFTDTNDKINKNDLSRDSKNLAYSDMEEYDDDLDGVQPLDSSVSSLINSPILDNFNVSKSSTRRSRGNKVINLINSFEKRTNESPKHSIRASDLLSMSANTVHNNSQNNAMQESISSARRVNLEDVFQSEDSLKNDFVNQTKIHEVNKSLNSENNVFNKTNTDEVLNDVLDKDKSNNTIEDEYHFASPLKYPLVNSITLTEHDDLSSSTLNCTKKDKNISEAINISETDTSKFNLSHNIEVDSETSINKHLIISDKVDDIKCSLSTSEINAKQKKDINKVQNCSKTFMQLKDTDRDVSPDKVEISNNLKVLENDHTNTPIVSKLIEKSTDVEKGDLNIKNCVPAIPNILESINTNEDCINVTNNGAREDKGNVNNDAIESILEGNHVIIQNDLKLVDVHKVDKQLVNVTDDTHICTIELIDITDDDDDDDIQSVSGSNEDKTQKNDLQSVDGSHKDCVNVQNNDLESIDVHGNDIQNDSLSVNGLGKESVNIKNNISKSLNVTDDTQTCPIELIDITDDDDDDDIQSVSGSNEDKTQKNDLQSVDGSHKDCVNVQNNNLELIDVHENGILNNVSESGDIHINDMKVQTNTIVYEDDIKQNNDLESVHVQKENIQNNDLESVHVPKENLQNNDLESVHVQKENIQNNDLELVHVPKENLQNNDLESVHVPKENLQNDVQSVSLSDEKTINILNTDLKPLENAKDIKKYRLGKLDDLIFTEEVSDEGSPSLVVRCMSKMYHPNIDHHEVTYSARKNNLLVINGDIKECANKNQIKNIDKLNKSNITCKQNSTSPENLNDSMMNSIEIELRKIHSDGNEDETNIANSMSNANNTRSKSPLNTLVDDLSDSTSITTLATEIIVGSNFSSNVVDLPTKNNSQDSKQNKSEKYANNELNIITIPKNELVYLTRKVVDEENTVSSGNNSNIEEIDETIEKKVQGYFENTLNTSIGKPKYESTPWNCPKNSKADYNSTSVQPNDVADAFDDKCRQRKNSNSSNSSCSSSYSMPEPEVWAQMLRDFNESVRKASITDYKVTIPKSTSRVLFAGKSITCKDDIIINNSTNIKNSNILKTEKQNTLQCSTISSCSPNKTLEISNKYTCGSRYTKNKNKLQNITGGDNCSFNRIDSNCSNDNKQLETKTRNSAAIKRKLSEIPQIQAKKKKSSSLLKVNSTKSKRLPETSSECDTYSSSSKYQSVPKKAKIMTKKKNNTISPSLLATRNLRVRWNESIESSQKNKKIKINVDEETSSSSDTELNSQRFLNVIKTSKRELHKTTTVKNTNKPTIGSKRNNSIIEFNTNKTKITEKSKKNTQSISTRIMRSNSMLIDSFCSKSDKTSPITKKSTKVTKLLPITRSKSNKSIQTKQNFASKPIKSDSSENDAEQSSETSEQVKELSKRKTRNITKAIQINNSSSSKSNEKEKNVETSSVPSQLLKRGCKFAADIHNSNKRNDSSSENDAEQSSETSEQVKELSKRKKSDIHNSNKRNDSSSENDAEQSSETSEQVKELSKRKTRNITKAIQINNSSSSKSNEKEKKVETSSVPLQLRKRGCKLAADIHNSNKRNDSSENEAEENPQTSEQVKELSKRKTRNITKAIQINNSSSSKSNEKEKYVETSSVPLQLRKRGCKLAADIYNSNKRNDSSSENDAEQSSEISEQVRELPKRKTRNIKNIQINNNSSSKSNEKEKNVETSSVSLQLRKRGSKLVANIHNSKRKSDSSSENEAEENPQTSAQIKELSKTKTRNIKKSIETSSVPSQLRKRGCKRAADTQISQPNSKGSKRDESSKVASTTIGHDSYSIQNVSSDLILTRNKAKLTVKQIHDSKKNPKSTKETLCDYSSDDSCSLNRRATTKNESNKNIKVKVNKNIKTTTPKGKKTKSTKHATDLANEYLVNYSPRKLRVREKK
ncbi:SMAD/FHA domain,Forkhead-associated (FHA) domain [Cinara cedri]|uniref:SMAD/FHA domain,Forkhead-associated (FHA) domain n=1 Tax=Cinara cedri TaxID=506608 RepID=A0A5E4M1Q7_9HEMI|nr:SMAD/FHA domain,Forkhead-associated (FHA) domain [Cinara cedri]